MYLVLSFILPLTIIIINSNVFCTIPGDPFPIDFNNQSDPFLLVDLDNPSDEINGASTHLPSSSITTTTLKSSSIDNFSPINLNTTFINHNKTSKTSPSSISKSLANILPIYKKHLVNIGQWKYIDPRTHETRYWYHTVGTIMGNGWIFDRILCQGYIRQKPDTVPIRAFHSETKGMWTNTLQIESIPLPIGNNQWKYDGTIFYAYNTSMNSSLLKPIWRYWNRINYGTEDVSEPRRSYLHFGEFIDDDLPDWRLDRILFYAFSPEMNFTEII